MFENLVGATPHIPIMDIWLDVQTRVGTPHKILRCIRSRWGTLHIPIECICLDIQTRVGTLYKWVTKIYIWGLVRIWSVKAEIEDLKHWGGQVVGRPAGWPVPDDFNTTLWLHLASWNLLDSQLSWGSKMESSVAINVLVWLKTWA